MRLKVDKHYRQALALYNFNSTLVRLKVKGKEGGKRRKKNFNSTLVRLKEGITGKVHLSLMYFNSTLVRLKAVDFSIKNGPEVVKIRVI